MSKEDQSYNIKELAGKWLSGTINESEKAYFEQWYKSFNDSEVIVDVTTYEDEAELKAGIFASLERKINGQANPKILPLWKKAWFSAAVIAVVFSGLWYFIANNPISFNAGDSRYANDIAPGKNRATITLANGKVLSLSSGQNGVNVKEGVLTYTDGSALAHSDNPAAELLAATPQGGTYQFTLPDGTRVWLNAGSSITFPSSFSQAKTRIVDITGEAYFEVAKDKTRPFIVKNNRQELIVLGTHFNLNTYKDEPAVETTLLEGSVEIYPTGTTIDQQKPAHHVLKPNQQAKLSGGEIKITEVDPETAVAWKNGYFKFNQESIQSIMRELSRWYDIDVSYESGLPQEKFTGRISRYKHISQVLKLMEAGKSVHFKVEGRRVTVIR